VRGGRRSQVELPSSDLYDREYFLSESCEGLTDYLAGRLSSVRRKELDLLEVSAGQRVLDLGCGRGEVAAELGRRGVTVSAVDYSADAVRLTRDVVPGVARADGAALPFRAGTFDRVLMGDVIEHLPWDVAVGALREVARVLAPGGRALVHTSPNTWFIRVVKPPLEVVLRLLRLRGPLEHFAEYDRLRAAIHPNELSPRTLPLLLRTAGIEGRCWVDRDVLRSGESEWTSAFPAPAVRLLTAVAGSWPLRLLLGNDLFAVFEP
jgi:ubiquinone/menaquinone biosynthesis C-methylase UbiE